MMLKVPLLFAMAPPELPGPELLSDNTLLMTVSVPLLLIAPPPEQIDHLRWSIPKSTQLPRHQSEALRCDRFR